MHATAAAVSPTADPSLLGTAQGVLLKFTLSNSEPFSKRLLRLPQAARGASSPPGLLVVPQTNEVGLHAFILELADAGFALADAFVIQETYHDLKGKVQHKGHFVFKSKAGLVLTPAQQSMLETHGRPLLERLVKEAMWQTVVYRNTLARGEGIAVICKGRVPFHGPTGMPITRWQIDAQGRHVGSAPQPIKPNKFLRVLTNKITLG